MEGSNKDERIDSLKAGDRIKYGIPDIALAEYEVIGHTSSGHVLCWLPDRRDSYKCAREFIYLMDEEESFRGEYCINDRVLCSEMKADLIESYGYSDIDAELWIDENKTEVLDAMWAAYSTYTRENCTDKGSDV